MGNIRKIEYRGTNNSLVNGEKYTYKEFAEVAGVSYRCFVSRAHNKKYITDKELVPLNAHKIPNKWKNKPDLTESRHETYFEKVSQVWLSKSL
jgi:hypothetical protein